MNAFFKKNKKSIIFTLSGMVAGLLYWKFVGCSSGSCSITSQWHNTMLYGGLMGYLLGDSIKPKTKKEAENNTISEQ